MIEEFSDWIGSPLYIQPFWKNRNTIQTASNLLVFLQPMYIPRRLTVDSAYFYIEGAEAGKNYRMGLYSDNGGTPVGGALLWQSGDISVATTGGKGASITPSLTLQRGIVWAALATQAGGTPSTYSSDFAINFIPPISSVVSAFSGVKYVLPAWGSLTDPCPAVAQWVAARPIMHFHVLRFDEGLRPHKHLKSYTSRLANPFCIRNVYCDRTSRTTIVANAVYLMPVYFPRSLTIKEMWCLVEIASGSIRMGLYLDNGGTPVGGRLIYDSGNISAASTGAKGGTLTPTVTVPRGLFWACIVSNSSGTQVSHEAAGQTFTGLSSVAPNFSGCRYSLGAFGPFTDPCPAVTTDGTRKPLFVFATSINE